MLSFVSWQDDSSAESDDDDEEVSNIWNTIHGSCIIVGK